MALFDLRDVVRHLDDFPGDVNVDVDDAIAHYGNVLNAYANPAFDAPRISPLEVDAIVSSCSFVRDLSASRPGLNGPLQMACQSWSTYAGKDYVLTRAHFQRPHVGDGAEVLPPQGFGLFTSTIVTSSGLTLWDAYMGASDNDCGDNSLFPPPRSRTKLEGINPTLRVAEIRSAGEWASFVQSFHKPVGMDGAVVNWVAAGYAFDAVHLSCSAVLAIQGARLELPTGRVTEPSRWDVESTLWLDWPFMLDYVLRSPIIGTMTNIRTNKED